MRDELLQDQMQSFRRFEPYPGSYACLLIPALDERNHSVVGRSPWGASLMSISPGNPPSANMRKSQHMLHRGKMSRGEKHLCEGPIPTLMTWRAREF